MPVLTVDVGTSVIKSVVFDDRGREAAVCRRSTEVSRPRPGWAEQDMDAVWEAVIATARGALARLGPGAGAVRAIGFTAQGDGCWLVDERGRPTGPAVLWSDGRAGDLLAEWGADGLLDRAYRRNGSLTCAGMPNAVLAWLGRNDPGRLERSQSALTAAGWLFRNLTGRIAIDESDASAPFLDHATGDYAPDLVELFGLGPAARLLPPVLAEGERAAQLTSAAAESLGLPAGIPVVMAPYDIAATALGAGAVEPGQACAILGTTLCMETVTTAVDVSGEPSGVHIAYGGRGRILRALPTLAGTEVLDWACRTLRVGGGPAELGELAFGGSEPGARGLGFLPYLSPAGERAPFLDPGVRGVFWGLSLDHTPADIARAVFEGLTLVVRDCLEASGAPVRELRLCGGGSANEQWCRLIADATGVPVLRGADSELGAKGAFLATLVATGEAAGPAEAVARYPGAERGWEPDPARTAVYDELHASRSAWRELAREQGRGRAAGPPSVPQQSSEPSTEPSKAPHV
jgi:xylulokinase